MGDKERALTAPERWAKFQTGKRKIEVWVTEESADEYRKVALEQGYSSVAEKLRDHINTEREQWNHKAKTPSGTREGIPLTVPENQPES
jgi:hypothetical protein